MRSFRRLAIPRHAHPLVRQMTEIQNAEQMGMLDLAERSGVNKNTLSEWRKRVTPSVANLEACLNVLGYELVIRRKRD